MTSKVEIFNGVALAVGAAEVTDVDEDTAAAIALRGSYDRILRTSLTRSRWGFAKRKQTLSKNTDPPLNEWQISYAIPAEALAIFKVYTRMPYEIYGKDIYTNADSLDVDLITQASEGDFPGYFENALVLELAALNAISITRNPEIATVARREAVDAWRIAFAADAMQYPSVPVVDEPFIWVRGT